MRTHPTLLTRVAASAALSLLALAPATAAHASQVPTPPSTGCPAGYTLTSLTSLHAISDGYQYPFFLDDPANGGNGDGFVCAKPLNPRAGEQLCPAPCVVPALYLFDENNIAQHH